MLNSEQKPVVCAAPQDPTGQRTSEKPPAKAGEERINLIGGMSKRGPSSVTTASTMVQSQST